jgi:hypothetical protein
MAQIVSAWVLQCEIALVLFVITKYLGTGTRKTTYILFKNFPLFNVHQWILVWKFCLLCSNGLEH